MTGRFDPTGPYEVDETDTPFARPAGSELPARIYSFVQPAGPDTDRRCVALVRDFIGRRHRRS